MTIVQVLKIQHGVFRGQLIYLEEFKKTASSATDMAGVRQIIFCITDALRKHSKVEEKHLFPALRPYLGETMCTAAVVEFEYAEILKIVSTLGKTNDTDATLLESSKFITYLRDHFAKEECVLFPLAEKKLTHKRLEALAAKAGLLK